MEGVLDLSYRLRRRGENDRKPLGVLGGSTACALWPEIYYFPEPITEVKVYIVQESWAIHEHPFSWSLLGVKWRLDWFTLS